MSPDGRDQVRRAVLADGFDLVARHAWGVPSAGDPPLSTVLADAIASHRGNVGMVLFSPKLLDRWQQAGLPHDQEARLRGLVRFRTASNVAQLALLRDAVAALCAGGTRVTISGGLADALTGTASIARVVLGKTEIALSPFRPDRVGSALTGCGWTMRGRQWCRPVAGRHPSGPRLQLAVVPRLALYDAVPEAAGEYGVAGTPSNDMAWTDRILAICVDLWSVPGETLQKRQALDRLHDLLLRADAADRHDDLRQRAHDLCVERALSDTAGLLRDIGQQAFPHLAALQVAPDRAARLINRAPRLPDRAPRLIDRARSAVARGTHLFARLSS